MNEQERREWLRQTREKQRQARSTPSVNATLTIPTQNAEVPPAPIEPTQAPPDEKKRFQMLKKRKPQTQALPENPFDEIAVYKPKRKVSAGVLLQQLQGWIGQKQEAAEQRRAARAEAKNQKKRKKQQPDISEEAQTVLSKIPVENPTPKPPKKAGKLLPEKKSKEKRKSIPIRNVLSSVRNQLVPLLIILSCLSLIFIAGVLAVPVIRSADFSFLRPPERSYTLRNAISAINAEQDARIDDLCKTGSHDFLDLSGCQTDWVKTLAVFMISENLPEISPDMVISQTRYEALRMIFRDLNQLSSEIAKTAYGRTLTVTASYLSTEDVCSLYDLTPEQSERLDKLLADAGTEWKQLLYGMGAGGSRGIVTAAMQQLVHSDDPQYWDRMGYARQEFPLFFVSWTAAHCGYSLGDMQEYGAVVKSFQQEGRWAGRAYHPVPGDLIVLDLNHDSAGDGIGIVDYVSDDDVHVIEGQKNCSIIRNSYALGCFDILGYCLPEYESTR